MRAIEIVAYDEAWPAAFQHLKGRIMDSLGDLILEIRHVGSTAVPGLCAKPKIDIDAVVRSEAALADAVPRMRAFDYDYHGDRYGNGMWTFTRSHGAYGERLYLCAPGNPTHIDRLRFRDYLRAHPDVASAYGTLKRQLAADAGGDWDHYTGGKTAFVADILRRSAMLPETDGTKEDVRSRERSGVSDMKLYSGPLSLFSRKVEIALGEKGLAFERVMVAFTQERGYQPKHPDVLAANPKGQVPVLVDGDITLFDSTLIFEYLEEAYPAPALLPQGAKARARCRLMELRADEVVFPHARTFFYRTDPPHPDAAERKANEEAGARAEAALRDHFAALDKVVGDSGFLCGALSYADIAMFMTIIWTQRLKGPPLKDYPALAAWFERLKARPPFGKAAAEIAAADRELTRPIGNA